MSVPAPSRRAPGLGLAAGGRVGVAGAELGATRDGGYASDWIKINNAPRMSRTRPTRIRMTSRRRPDLVVASAAASSPRAASAPGDSVVTAALVTPFVPGVPTGAATP